MFLAFISIGSNINSSENIGKAKILLDLAFDDCIYSSIYQSKAIGFKGPLFKNLVASFKTSLEPGALNVSLKIMEKNIGRDESQKNYSSRVIDLDLIIYEDLIMSKNGIEIPSPDIEKYIFILEPLVEISGGLRHPKTKKLYKDLLDEMKLSLEYFS